MCLCVFTCSGSDFYKPLGIVTSLLVSWSIFRMSRSRRTSRSSGRQDYRSKRLSVCPVWALTFKCLDPQTLFWHAVTSSERPGKGEFKVVGLRSRSYERKYTFAGDLHSSEGQSCSLCDRIDCSTET